MDTKKSKSFQEWTQGQLEFAFGVVRVLQSTPEMDLWEDRAKTMTISATEKAKLQELQTIAIEDLDGWNERELRENLIVHLEQNYLSTLQICIKL